MDVVIGLSLLITLHQRAQFSMLWPDKLPTLTFMLQATKRTQFWFRLSTIFNIISKLLIGILKFQSVESRIARVDITSPAGMTYTSPLPYPGRPGVVFVNTTWTPTAAQIGSHILCALAEDNIGSAYFTIFVLIVI